MSREMDNCARLWVFVNASENITQLGPVKCEAKSAITCFTLLTGSRNSMRLRTLGEVGRLRICTSITITQLLHWSQSMELLMPRFLVNGATRHQTVELGSAPE